jgi:hypothetical protein
MKRIFPFILYLVFEACGIAQQTNLPADSIPNGYFITHSRAELMQKFADLPLGINVNDSIPDIIRKLEAFMLSYQPRKQYQDDAFASVVEGIRAALL